MPTEAEGSSHARTSVSGGASAEPTPANAVSDRPRSNSREKPSHKGGSHALLNEGPGHIAAHNPRSTIGGFLGLRDQKTRAENNFLAQSDQVSETGGTSEERTGTTCTTEDHSFMGKKPGASDALPGWQTVKNIIPGASK